MQNCKGCNIIEDGIQIQNKLDNRSDVLKTETQRGPAQSCTLRHERSGTQTQDEEAPVSRRFSQKDLGSKMDHNTPSVTRHALPLLSAAEVAVA